MTNTSVSKAKGCRSISAYGKKYTSSRMASLSSHLDKRLTRLSGLARAGALVAMLGSWLLLLPTMPLMNAARVVKCWARRPLGSPGYHSDFSVALFRSDFVLVSEKNHMKAHKN